MMERVVHTDSQLHIEAPRLWELNDPYLYRVTVSLEAKEHSESCDETSIKTGFRESIFKDGYFRLNGKRVFFDDSPTGQRGSQPTHRLAV